MNLEFLEEEISQILNHGYDIRKDKNGQIVIYTRLKEANDGELVEMEDDEDLEETDEEDEELDLELI